MTTKKELKKMDREVRAIYETFVEMNWLRYRSKKVFNFKPYDYKLWFEYKDKFTQTFYITKEQYNEWRGYLDKLIKTNEEKIK